MSKSVTFSTLSEDDISVDDTRPKFFSKAHLNVKSLVVYKARILNDTCF